MQNWYSRDFMSSSQTAARLVFNIENSVDRSRVLNVRPTRPPDSMGKEAFMYVMDGAATRSVKDLTIDELSPWNSKKCKSSTRFSWVQFDNAKNSLIFNRYIISDTSIPDKPACLFACYYCKHPIFDLVKKIFYACDGKRERCLPGTFVIFVYEFNKAEHLYRTQRYFSTGRSVNSDSEPVNFVPNFKPGTSALSLLPQAQQSSSQEIPKHMQFLEPNTTMKFDKNLTEWDDYTDTDGNSFFDLDGLFNGKQQPADELNPGSSSLAEILQTCEAVTMQQRQQPIGSNCFPQNHMASTSGAMNSEAQYHAAINSQYFDGKEEIARKRRKIAFRPLEMEHSGNGVNFGNEFLHGMNTRSQSTDSSSLVATAGQSPGLDGAIITSETTVPMFKPFRHVFISEILFENFCQNCLCDADYLTEEFDTMDESFMKIKKMDQIKEILKEQSGNGGCLLIDTDFQLSPELRANFVWFQNPTFIQSTTCQPVVQPVAVCITKSNGEWPDSTDNRQFLLDELANRIGQWQSAKKKETTICRAFIANPLDDLEANDLDSWSMESEQFSFPCIRLVTLQQTKHWLRHKFSLLSGTNNADEDYAATVESELFDKQNGVLESLTFEQFLSRQRAVEKKWPNGFRSWFREKSGWIFEHCSLGTRLKAGFHNEAQQDEFDLSKVLETLREEVRLSFTAAQNGAEPVDGNAQTNIDLETITEALELICTDYLRKAMNALLDPNDGTNGIIPANNNLWIGREQWAQLSMKERHDRLFPLGLSLLLEISDLTMMDPIVFWGLDRAQKRALISKANSMKVMEIPQENLTKEFVVLNNAGRVANYVQIVENSENDGGLLYCQCNGGESVNLCEHLLAVALKHSDIARKLPNFLNKSCVANNGLPGLQLESTQSVEIICCSSSNNESSPLN